MGLRPPEEYITVSTSSRPVVLMDFPAPPEINAASMRHSGNVTQGDYCEKYMNASVYIGTPEAVEDAERAMRERREQPEGANNVRHIATFLVPLQRTGHVDYACSTCGTVLATLSLRTLPVVGYAPLFPGDLG